MPIIATVFFNRPIGPLAPDKSLNAHAAARWQRAIAERDLSFLNGVNSAELPYTIDRTARLFDVRNKALMKDC